MTPASSTTPENLRPQLASAPGSAAEETLERRMWVVLTAAGFAGRFEIPEKHFNTLLGWLAERSCGKEKQPNEKLRDGQT